MLVGMCPSSEVSFPISAVQNREIRVTGTFRYANTYPEAIALDRLGAIDLEGLVDARFSLGVERGGTHRARSAIPRS